ncbi:MAG: PEP-utilizing enzyme [Oculatellaceae cyanobacterium Prado106]|nr:PEP-utilizing enzyme [Oculatellaceae cyanobacterium Prado106]
MTFILEATSPPSLLGGKAGALAQLAQTPSLQRPFPIPAWFALSPQAFEASLSDAHRQQWVKARLAQAESAQAENLETLWAEFASPQFVAQFALHPQVQAELTAALAALCSANELVAVRSSAQDEDGTTHSFAGQLDSFLNVPIAQVAAHIIAVWQSGFSDRILTYRREHHLSLVPTVPTVLIQKMVPAAVAGVAFSANPVTGQRGNVVVSAVQGLGDRLVAGIEEGETYWVERSGVIGKLMQPRRTEDDPNSESANEPDRLLTDEQICAIAQLARQVEQHFGRPQDIEWAIANPHLYLLQARPITSLTQMADPDGVLNLWDNSNIAESYGGITTPLTFSFARRAYEAVYRQFCRMMGVSEGAIAQHDATFRRMLGLVQGRIYYNLLNWYRVLALLPGFQMNRAFMEQMMGVREPLPEDVVATLTQATWSDKLQDSLRFAKTLAGLLKNYFTLPHQIRHFYRRLDQALSPTPDTIPLESLRPDELAAYYLDLESQLLTRWDAPLVNDFFAMIFYGLLRKLTATWCNDTAGTLQNDLISGEGGMISAEPAHLVQQMAQTVQADPAFITLLCQGSLAQILSAIVDRPPFLSQYQTYLDKFGDRCLEELKLESSTLRDDPILLLRSVGQLAVSEGEKARGEGGIFINRRDAETQREEGEREEGEREEGEREKGERGKGKGDFDSSTHPPIYPSTHAPSPTLRQQAEAKVTQSLQRHPFRKFLFNAVLRNARARVRDRENLRFERTRVFGRVRQILLEMGKRFYGLDLLDSPRDIFYLELHEILGMVDGTAACTDLRGLVAVRQAEFDRYRQEGIPGDRFQTHGMVYPSASHPNSVQTAAAEISSDSLQGTGCCPGVVRAPVQVITDPRRATLKRGSILVAERTDPGWIMLFPSASGLLVERGSLLSHSAIVAREMGIPAIVSIPQVTQWLQDGDWVEMDGSTGLIQKINPPVNSSETSNSHSSEIYNANQFERLETNLSERTMHSHEH